MYLQLFQVAILHTIKDTVNEVANPMIISTKMVFFRKFLQREAPVPRTAVHMLEHLDMLVCPRSMMLEDVLVTLMTERCPILLLLVVQVFRTGQKLDL
jgi:hypothetical protein